MACREERQGADSGETSLPFPRRLQRCPDLTVSSNQAERRLNEVSGVYWPMFKLQVESVS